MARHTPAPQSSPAQPRLLPAAQAIRRAAAALIRHMNL
jgi:hypothetical protein